MPIKFRSGITPDRLREVLNYDPQTGGFTWKYDPRKPRNWNTRRAGKPAGGPQESNEGKLYHVIRVDDVLYMAHRLAWLYVHGAWPSDRLDHEDGDGLHNWIDNLRPATQAQNTFNRGVQSNSRSGHKGIQKRGDSYRVRVTAHGQTVQETCYSLEDAIAWQTKMAKLIHGEFAHKSTSARS